MLGGVHMADKLDHLLSDYFTGKLATNIRLRKMELQFNSDRTPDENIGGRKQNDYNNPVELRMIREQRDTQLQQWILQKDIIDSFYVITIAKQQRVLKAYYGKGQSWVEISLNEHIGERTCLRWRDDFKSGIAGHLYSTVENGVSIMAGKRRLQA